MKAQNATEIPQADGIVWDAILANLWLFHSGLNVTFNRTELIEMLGIIAVAAALLLPITSSVSTN